MCCAPRVVNLANLAGSAESVAQTTWLRRVVKAEKYTDCAFCIDCPYKGTICVRIEARFVYLDHYSRAGHIIGLFPNIRLSSVPRSTRTLPAAPRQTLQVANGLKRNNNEQRKKIGVAITAKIAFQQKIQTTALFNSFSADDRAYNLILRQRFGALSSDERNKEIYGVTGRI